MTRETYTDILKRRSGWRLFWPFGLREDMDDLLVAVLANLDAPKPEPAPDLKPELERVQQANKALSKWITTMFGLDKIPAGGPVVDLIAQGKIQPPKKND